MLKCKGNLSLLTAFAVYARKTGIMLLKYLLLFSSVNPNGHSLLMSHLKTHREQTLLFFSQYVQVPATHFLPQPFSFSIVVGWSYLLFHAI